MATHSHPLTKSNNNSNYSGTRYSCDGCKTKGTGWRYACRPCNFDLHIFCAQCPPKLSSFMDKEHKLLLRPKQPISKRPNCDMCDTTIKGFFYSCNLCSLFFHPLCTQFPEKLDHSIDSDHYLLLKYTTPGRCNICSDICKPWHYNCATCRIDICLGCASLDYDPESDEEEEDLSNRLESLQLSQPRFQSKSRELVTVRAQPLSRR